MSRLTQPGLMYFAFCRLYPSSPQPPRQCLAPSCLPVISLLLTKTVSSLRACLIHMIGEVSWEPNRRRAWASQYFLIPRWLNPTHSAANGLLDCVKIGMTLFRHWPLGVGFHDCLWQLHKQCFYNHRLSQDATRNRQSVTWLALLINTELVSTTFTIHQQLELPKASS
jgi:hypothetical protein